jgi:hypothetical protein
MDKHDEARHLLNVMRSDYADALVAGIEDEKAYDALFASLTKQYADGNLPVPLLIKLLAFATRRLAIKKIEAKLAEAQRFPLHTPN